MTKHRLQFIFAGLLTLLILQRGYSQQIILPDIGDSGAALITPEEEQRTGAAVVRNIRRAGGILDDPVLNEYINSLGHKLVAASPDAKTAFHFFIVNDGGINAFALPGGYIGVNYGLILAMRSESELAAVLAHEIAHVTQRHYARRFTSGNGSNWQILAAMLAAIILGSQDSELGQAAFMSIAASSAQKQINFTRSNEMEADRIGIEVLADAGYDPNSMADTFQVMADSARLYGPQLPEFLLTHPVSSTRLADARNRAILYPRHMHFQQLQYHIARAKLRVITSVNINDTLKAFEQNIKTGSYLQQEAEMYGYALALLEKQHYKQTRQYVKLLLKSNKNSIAFKLLEAKLEYNSGNKKLALNKLQQALSLYPDNPTLTEYYAEMLIDSGNVQAAKIILQKFLRNPNRNPKFYKLLSATETKLNNPVGAYEALAIYYYEMGQTHHAITQINIALKEKNIDFYTSSRLESRLKELKHEIVLLESTQNNKKIKHLR